MNELLWGMNEVKSPQLSRRQELSSHQQRDRLENLRYTNLASFLEKLPQWEIEKYKVCPQKSRNTK